MKLEFKKENIKYIDLIGRTITFAFKDLDVAFMAFSYESTSFALVMLNEFVSKYDLVKSDGYENLYVSEMI